jgi:diguanylate cyclase (GGDEF)-like protein
LPVSAGGGPPARGALHDLERHHFHDDPQQLSAPRPPRQRHGPRMPMSGGDRIRHTADQQKRIALMVILALSWLSTLIAWILMEQRGASSPALRDVFVANIVFHPVMFLIIRKRLLPQRIVDLACLLFGAGICAGCMALALYFPVYGASIDLKPLYLWIPVIYVFAFTLTGHKTSLAISLAMLALFFMISLPYLLRHAAQPDGNFTIQMLLVSAVLIAALHFLSSYQRRLQVTQMTVDELAHLANTDELTRLPNRRLLAERVESELVRFARYGRAFTVILLDIDHFKSVNDRFGHPIGDRVLVALTARVQKSLREVDTLGRWGGEEFIIILPEVGLDEGLHKAEALCASVAIQALFGDHAITISCGVADVRPGDTADSLFHRADAALYVAKRRGRNRAECVAPTDAPASDTPMPA